MTRRAIHATGLGKRYRLGRVVKPHVTLRESVVDATADAWRAAGALVRGSRPRRPDPQDFWALRDVSFDVGRGEAVGLVGGNGAGKSTLLKLLSRITAPTTGRAEIRGRVGSLLEVGTGFHPELSGRENTFLNGAILGMRRAEVARKFDEIVAFAEVERFIDTPVKRYSSGMYLRLAFAVAAHLEPEVLLVDEVLAVGDAAFQRKCLGKMHDVMELGRTVVFVSHNMAAVQSLCRRALWLHAGTIRDDGPATTVVGRYLQAATQSLTERTWPDAGEAPGNDRVRLRRAAVAIDAERHDGDGRNADGDDGITTRTPIRLEVEYWNLRPGARVSLSLQVHNEEGVLVFTALPVTERAWGDRPRPAGLFRDVCHVPGDLLNDGGYRVQLVVLQDAGTAVYRHDGLLAFDVRDSVEWRGGWHGRWAGAVRPLLRWHTELVVAGAPDELPPDRVTAHAVAGYAHPAYAAALADGEAPVALPTSGGWLLARPIPGDARRDLVGCYPLFACRDWAALADDLAALPASHVSVTLVADPFGAHDEPLLARCFPELHAPYKAHFVTDLRRPDAAIVAPHHRRNARRAQRAVDVEVCAHPPAHLDAWTALYANLARRHGIVGPAAFSRASFAAQLAVPGLVALRAVRAGKTVGMTLWYEQGDVAYYHLGAYADAGYEHRAAFALFAAALAHFRGRVDWLALGAGAGVTSDGDDGLSRFKRGWATGTRTARLCGRVLDRAAYAALAAGRAGPAADRAVGPRGGYFPAYRAAPPPTSGDGSATPSRS